MSTPATTSIARHPAADVGIDRIGDLARARPRVALGAIQETS